MKFIRYTAVAVLLWSCLMFQKPCAAQSSPKQTSNALLISAPRPRSHAMSTTETVINFLLSLFGN